jgi:plastocyanin
MELPTSTAMLLSVFADFRRRSIMATDNGASNSEDQGSETGVTGTGAPNRDRAWQEWMMVGVGLTGLLSIMATIVAVVALASPGTQTVQAAPASSAAVAPTSSTTAVAKSEAVKLVIKSDSEHGRLGPDGKWHDAFLPANFTVHAGDRVTVTVYNYDSGQHSFTSSSLSATALINQMIPAGSPTAPSKTTFTFTAPDQTGQYAWWCAVPCDPWAMAHVGYMRGNVTVAA